MGSEFILDETLKTQSHEIGQLDLCNVRLMDDSRFPWILLVPRLPNLREIYEVSRGDRGLLMEEMAHTSEALEQVTGCDKVNVAAFGNQLAQLHIHVIARFKGDPAWPNPIWSASGQVVAYGAMQRDQMIDGIARALQIQPKMNVV